MTITEAKQVRGLLSTFHCKDDTNNIDLLIGSFWLLNV